MNDINKNPQKKILLEDLLKLKRQEKPDQAFWDKFNKELHKKTLQELVYKPSLVSRILNIFDGYVVKPLLSAGALAILTIALFTYNHHSDFYSKTSLMAQQVNVVSSDAVFDHASAKKNFVKNTITTMTEDNCHYTNSNVSTGSISDGVRYLAGNLGNLASASFDFNNNGIGSNRIY